MKMGVSFLSLILGKFDKNVKKCFLYCQSSQKDVY